MIGSVAASARIIASGNRFSAYVCMFYQYCCSHGLVSGYLLQSAALQQAYKSTRVGRAHWAMLGTRCYATIHHSDMCIDCLRLHPRRQSPAGYLAGSGPCYEHQRPCSWRRGWRLGINLQHGADVRDPKSLQLSPRSCRIMLCK